MIDIKFKKWDKDINKNLFKKSINLLGISDIQLYFPIFSLFFYIHNTKNANKLIDLFRKYYVIDFTENIYESYLDSNKIYKGTILNNFTNVVEEKEIFCKCIPLLNPINYIKNNYYTSILNNNNNNNIQLPNNYIYNTQEKINNIHNSAYIDTFFSYIGSEITNKNILPCFPIYYGSFNCIKKKFTYDISDEYDEINNEKWFNKYIGKLFSINIYINDSLSENSSKISNGSSYNEDYDDKEYICNIYNMPVQYLFMEKLNGTLEDLLNENYQEKVIKSCLFQIIFSLCYLQKHYKFTHNDLHINNIMYTKTKNLYLYYI